MRVGSSTSHTDRMFLYYRCDNKSCTRPKKSIRAKVIFDFIYDFLADGLNFTEAEYTRYYEGISGIMGEKREKIQMELNSKRGALKAVRSEIDELGLALLRQTDKQSTIYKSGSRRLSTLELKAGGIEEDISKLKSQLTNPEQDKLTLKQFLNLSKNAVLLAKSDIPEIKDQICRYLFLNHTVDNEKMASYRLKLPFDVMPKSLKSTSSRGGRN